MIYTKDMTIAEMIQADPNVVPILLSAGMHCIGCPASMGETIEEAAMVHGLDADMLLEDINQLLQQQ